MSKIQLLILLKPAPCADFPHLSILSDTQETDKNANRKGMVLHYLSAQFFKCLTDLTIPPRSTAASPHQNSLLVYCIDFLEQGTLTRGFRVRVG